MKLPKINLITTMANLCLVCAYVLHWEGCCLLFFGEYPFPEE